MKIVDDYFGPFVVSLFLFSSGEEMRICTSLFTVFLSFAMPLASFANTDADFGSSEGTIQKVKVLSWAPRIFLIEKFLTAFECDYLILKARPELKRSTVVSSFSEDGEVHEGRTSKGMFFQQNSSDLVLRSIEKRIAEITMLPQENGEAIQVLSYGLGEEYRPHFDYFDNTTEGGALCYNRGGQRVATLIMYLEDTEEGGETVFPKAGIKVKPIKGNAVLFYNCTPDGVEDPLTLHGGAPVTKGQKWIATKWIRKKEFH